MEKATSNEPNRPIRLWKKIAYAAVLSALIQGIIMVLIVTLRVNGWEKNWYTTAISRTLEAVSPTLIGFAGLSILKVYVLVLVGSMLSSGRLRIGELPCYGDAPAIWFASNMRISKGEPSKLAKWAILLLLAIWWIFTQIEVSRLAISEKIIKDSYVELDYNMLSANNFKEAKDRWLNESLEYTANIAFYGIEKKDGYTVYNSTTVSTFTVNTGDTLQELVEARLEFNSTLPTSVKVKNYMTQYIVVTTKCVPTSMKTARIGGVDVVKDSGQACRLLLDYSRVEKNVANGVVCNVYMSQERIALDLDKTWNGYGMLDIDSTVPFDSVIQAEVCSAMAKIRDDYRTSSGGLSYTWSFPTTKVDRNPNLPGVMVTGVVENEISQYIAILLRFLAEQNPKSAIKYSSSVYMAIIDNTKLGGKAIPLDIMVVNIISSIVSVIACVLAFRIKGFMRLNAEAIIDPVAIQNKERTQTTVKIRKENKYIKSSGDDTHIKIEIF